VNLFLIFRSDVRSFEDRGRESRRVLRSALALATLLFLLSPSASAASRTVDIEVGSNPDGSMYLRPGNVTVNLGDVVTLRIHNPDRIFHDVALLDYDGNDIEIEVPGGSTEEKTFTASVAGDFRVICEVRGHKQAGMQGTLHVVEEKGLPIPALAPALALALAALVAARRRG
jgi:uncharacterized cupredoxin-like copper-binding protein